uniref:Uncharacterized protein n=1 Tax=Lutzomyia longipalpis TaxID=7200 RepID=A0A7G3B8M5_LUTLO
MAFWWNSAGRSSHGRLSYATTFAFCDTLAQLCSTFCVLLALFCDRTFRNFTLNLILEGIHEMPHTCLVEPYCFTVALPLVRFLGLGDEINGLGEFYGHFLSQHS